MVDSLGTAESSILGKSLCIIDKLMDSFKNAMLSSVDKMLDP